MLLQKLPADLLALDGPAFGAVLDMGTHAADAG